MTLTMWWPAPEVLNDLSVDDAEDGFTLSAPNDTECGEWLAHWNQSEEHQKVFHQAFTEVLENYLKHLTNEDGKTES